jgi:hypothetical protein
MSAHIVRNIKCSSHVLNSFKVAACKVYEYSFIMCEVFFLVLYFISRLGEFANL